MIQKTLLISQNDRKVLDFKNKILECGFIAGVVVRNVFFSTTSLFFLTPLSSILKSFGTVCLFFGLFFMATKTCLETRS